MGQGHAPPAGPTRAAAVLQALRPQPKFLHLKTSPPRALRVRPPHRNRAGGHSRRSAKQRGAATKTDLLRGIGTTQTASAPRAWTSRGRSSSGRKLSLRATRRHGVATAPARAWSGRSCRSTRGSRRDERLGACWRVPAATESTWRRWTTVCRAPVGGLPTAPVKERSRPPSRAFRGTLAVRRGWLRR